MNILEEQKIIEVILYILNKSNKNKELNYYDVFDILYSAYKYQLLQYGNLLIKDILIEYKHKIYFQNLNNSIEDLNYKNKLHILLLDNIDVIFSKNIFHAKRICNLDYLSRSNIKCLNRAIKNFKLLKYFKIKRLFYKNKENIIIRNDKWTLKKEYKILSPIDIAIKSHADKSMIDYIEENIELDKYL